jgi:hypothetical protein
MSQYVTQLCEALIHVLDRAVTFKRHRLAGYMANLDFWADEVMHRTRLIDGRKARRENMITWTDASLRYEIEAGYAGGVPLDEFDTSTDWRATADEIELLRTRLLATSSRFLRRGFDEGLIDREKLLELEDRLQVRA